MFALTNIFTDTKICFRASLVYWMLIVVWSALCTEKIECKTQFNTV